MGEEREGVGRKGEGKGRREEKGIGAYRDEAPLPKS